jgi:HK97 gp10 family phage protein
MTDVRMEFKSDIEAGFNRLLSAVDGKVLLAGTAAMARTFYYEVKLNAAKHIKSGALYEAIYRVFAKELSAPGRVVYRVSWNRQKAPHGHLIEFGTSRAPAYPFVRPAFDRAQDAVQAGKARMAEVIAQGVA